MSEQRDFWYDVKVGVTIAAICGAGAILWSYHPQILRFLGSKVPILVWLLGLIGISFAALGLWALIQYIDKSTALDRLQKVWEEKIGRPLESYEVEELRRLSFFPFKPRDLSRDRSPIANLYASKLDIIPRKAK